MARKKTTSHFKHALKIIDRVMKEGKTTRWSDDWRLQPGTEHIRHARLHLDCALIAGEAHLSHAACRLLMALEVMAR